MDNWSMMNQYGMGQMDPTQMNNWSQYGAGGQMQNRLGVSGGVGQADPYQQQPTASGGMGTIDSQGNRNRFGGYPGTRPSAGVTPPTVNSSGFRPNYANMPPMVQDMLKKQNPNISPFFSGSNQGPYQMPGGPGQISAVGAGQGQIGGPRPQQPPPQFAPGQQAYNGPKIAPMQRPPQSAFGQQNPTQYVPGFQPNASMGFGRGNIQNPYQQQGQNRGW